MYQNPCTITKSARLLSMMFCLIMLLLVLTVPNAYAASDGVLKMRLDPEGLQTIDIQVKNCMLSIEPTDDDYPLCVFDSNRIKVKQEVIGQKQSLTISSASGKRMGNEAIATLFLPRDAYTALMLKAQEADVMLMNGIEIHQTISLFKSRIGVQYTALEDKLLSLDLIDSICDFAIPETATGYKIKAKIEGGKVSVPSGTMPEYKGGESYEYTNGDGSTLISAYLMNQSNLNIVLTRSAN